MRYGRTINRFHANRKYTHLVSQIPEADRVKFATLIEIEEVSYNYSLTPAFKQAVKDAESKVEQCYALPSRAPQPNAPPPPRGGAALSELHALLHVATSPEGAGSSRGSQVAGSNT